MATFFIEENPGDSWRPSGFNRGLWLRKLLLGPSREFDSYLVRHLRQQNHAVALALLDMDQDTAGAVQILNSAYVPVIAWLNLSDRHGYRSSGANVLQTAWAIEAFLDWGARNDLEFAGLGINWEIPIWLVANLKDEALWRHYWRLRTKWVKRLPQLQQMLVEVKSRGMYTEIYTMPLLLNVLFGLVTQPVVDRKVLMAHTSILPRWLSPRLAVKLMRLGNKPAIPAFGIVSANAGSSPGRDFGGGVLPRHLSVQELAACIKAAQTGGDAYVFALDHPRVVRMWEQALKLATR